MEHKPPAPIPLDSDAPITYTLTPGAWNAIGKLEDKLVSLCHNQPGDIQVSVHARRPPKPIRTNLLYDVQTLRPSDGPAYVRDLCETYRLEELEQIVVAARDLINYGQTAAALRRKQNAEAEATYSDQEPEEDDES